MKARVSMLVRLFRECAPQIALVRMLLAFVLLSLLRPWATAQQTPASSNPTSTPNDSKPPKPGTKSEEEKEIERREQSQRALSLIPEFAVTDRHDAPPLTSGEKFHLFAKEAFDPATLGAVGLQAGLSQALNEFPGYGQGMQGYGKRFGASLADEVSSNFWSIYFYPTLLKQDPRYFRLGEGGFGHRFFYGMEQEFVCHTDKGAHAFSYSSVLGAFTSGGISNLYYPGKMLIRTVPATSTTPAMPVYESDRGLVLTMSRASIAFGYGMAGNLFDEFWPDIQRKVFHKQKDPGSRLPSGSQR